MKTSSDMEKKLESILRLLDNLAYESSRGIPIIVEGKKDLEALNELEIKGNLIAAKDRSEDLSGLLVEIEGHGKNEVILLMDFDREGRELTKRLTQHLERMKIKPNTVFWKELSAFLRRDVKDIESLPAYIRTLKRKIGKI